MFSIIAALLLGFAPGLESNIFVAQPGVPTVEGSAFIPLDRNLRVEEQVSAIIEECISYERAGNLEMALRQYSAALHRFPGVRSLQSQYSRVKVLYDIQKRFETDWYMNTAGQYDTARLRVFVRNFWNIVMVNFVQSFTETEIFYRETRCMDLALGSETFRARVLPNAAPREIEAFREEIRQFVRDSIIRSRNDLTNSTLEIGRRFQNRFGQNASLLVMEGLFDCVTSLDSYSEVLLPDQYQEVLSSVSGNMVGLGVTIKTQDSRTEIVRIVPNSPAANSDLRPGDEIIAINDESVVGCSNRQVSVKLEGPMGSSVSLRVQAKDDLPREIVLIRKPITMASVEHAMILPDSDGIGYFRLNGFQQNSATEMLQTLSQLKEQGMSSLIIDLRGNGGGTVDSAVAISELFLDEGNILQVKSAGSEFIHRAHLDSEWNEIPLILLIDGESASASEIFAGAIQGLKRGVLIGTRSFGKGVIQKIYPIPESPFVMKLTTSQFFGPSGNRYNYVGVNPNYEVREAGKPIFYSDGTARATERDFVLEKAQELLGENHRVSMK
ncbi:MAG: PDZ domain-containing protein [Thermoguttaceae bacterium]|nr:PDZ domain-containing protein [Thermoguttaceae bacterium]